MGERIGEFSFFNCLVREKESLSQILFVCGVSCLRQSAEWIV